MNPNITILLAVYNGADFLSAQIDSILSQTFKNWQLIIHDDNSTDNSVEIIKNYAHQFPEKIIFIDDKQSYLSAKGNFSFLLSQVDPSVSYIMFSDQDDIWKPNKIEITIDAMLQEEHNRPDIPILIHTDLEVVDENLELLHKSLWEYENINPSYNSFNRLLLQNTVTGCTMMINKKLLELALPIPQEAIMHDWWLGLVASNFGTIHYISQSTMRYRQHTINSIGAKKFNYFEGIKKVFNHVEFSNHTREKILQAKAFLKYYKDILNPETYCLLQDFVTLESKTFLERRKILLKYKILKQGLVRNIGLLLKI